MEYSTKPIARHGELQKNRTVATFFFIIIIFLAFVGTDPFASSFRGDLRTLQEAEGSIIRQALLIISFSYLIFSIHGELYLRLKALSPMHILLFGWIFTTILWSPDAFLSAKRIIITFLTFSLSFLFWLHLGTEGLLRTLATTLAALCIISLFSGLITPAAIHQPGETAGLVGSWRGIFPHKNNAGFAAAIGVLLSVFQYRVTQKTYWLIIFLAELLLIYLSNSKTAFILLTAILLLYLIINWSIKSNNTNYILGIIATQIFTVMIVSLIFLRSEIYNFLSDPTNLTNRVFVWNLIVNAWSERPITGVGFGSLWVVDSEKNLLLPFLNGQYLAINQGHNGFLDIVATTGIIGFLLSILVVFGLSLRAGFKSSFDIAIGCQTSDHHPDARNCNPCG